MKRDMDFVRELLLKIEKIDKPPSLQELLCANANEAEYEKLAEHLSMLIDEAEFVSGIPLHTMLAKNWTDLRLTWKGHDFLDSVRDPEIWEKTKKGVEGAGGFTVDLLKDLAKGFIKKQIEEHTGVKL
jgi:hypothetical protein